MQRRPLGRSGLMMSRLALGTMTWGLDTDPEEAGVQLKAYVDAGGTVVDTADVYADGEAEAVLGTLLDAMVSRDELLIIAKAGLSTSPGRQADASRAHLLSALDTTLQRLGVSHVDLWQVHGYDFATPLEETLAALDFAVSSGRARYAGLSNFTGWQTARAATWQQAWPGRAPIVATAMEYSLLQRDLEREVLPACTALGIGVLAWSPLGRGVLTGKYRHDRPADSRAASPHFNRFIQPYLQPRCSAIVESLATAAAGLGISAAEAALIWVRDRPGITAALVGARTADQLRMALGTEPMTLPAEIVAALDDVSAGRLAAGHLAYPDSEGAA